MASMLVQMTVADFESLVQRSVAAALQGKPLADIAASVAAGGGASAKAAGKKEKKPKKEKDPSAPKREANDWIKFTQRVRALLKTEGFDTGVEVTQFCGELKEKMARKSVTDAKGNSKEAPDYESISDEGILSARRAWEKPEQSKQELAGKNKRKTSGGSSVAGSEDGEEAAADSDADSAASGEKKKRQWSPEAKARAAEKRAAKKAAAKASSGDEAKAAPAVVAPAAKAAAPAPVKASPPPPPKADESDDESEAEDEEDIQAFEPFGEKFAQSKFKSEDWHVNCRGDVVNGEMGWVGKYNPMKDKLDKKAPKPADIDC